MAQVNALSDRWIDLKPLEDLDPYFLQRVMQTGEVLYVSEDNEIARLTQLQGQIHQCQTEITKNPALSSLLSHIP